MDERVRRRYERPFINDLSTEYLAFADGSLCITGAHLISACNDGLFASQCSNGFAFSFNECFAGPRNVVGS